MILDYVSICLFRRLSLIHWAKSPNLELRPHLFKIHCILPLLVLQDTFDHDKGQKSVFSGAVSTGFFESSSVDILPVSPGFSVQFSKEITPKMWRKLPGFRTEKKNAEPCHISVSHGLLGPEFCLQLNGPSVLLRGDRFTLRASLIV